MRFAPRSRTCRHVHKILFRLQPPIRGQQVGDVFVFIKRFYLTQLSITINNFFFLYIVFVHNNIVYLMSTQHLIMLEIALKNRFQIDSPSRRTYGAIINCSQKQRLSLDYTVPSKIVKQI